MSEINEIQIYETQKEVDTFITKKAGFPYGGHIEFNQDDMLDLLIGKTLAWQNGISSHTVSFKHREVGSKNVTRTNRRLNYVRFLMNQAKETSKKYLLAEDTISQFFNVNKTSSRVTKDINEYMNTGNKYIQNALIMLEDHMNEIILENAQLHKQLRELTGDERIQRNEKAAEQEESKTQESEQV